MLSEPTLTTKAKRIGLLCKCTILVWLFFVNSVQAQVKPTTAAERLNGLQKRKLLEEKSLLKNITFRNIGPVQMNGRVVDIEANPDDPTEFYVAYASGGLWYTHTNGQSFTPLFDKEDAMTIGDVAVNWKTGTVWVGTGEANSSRSSYSGIGVYKSTDKGKTWQYLGLPESQHIGKIVLHPSDDNTAWVAVLGHLYSPNKERGVYKTTDGGKTWKQTLYIDENTGAVEMDINNKNPSELYATVWHRERRAWDWIESGKTSAIYKSNDGGDTWKDITQPGSGFATGDKLGRIGVAVFQKNPGIVYAVIDNNNLKPDTAKKKIDSTKYNLDDFKNITREAFAALDNKKLDTFLMRNGFDEKYRSASVKELVRNDKVKPTAVYDWLVADDGFQNAGIIGCEVYRSDDAGATWKKTNTKELTTFSTYGYYFAKLSLSATDENKVVVLGFNCIYSSDGGKTFKPADKNTTHADWHACWIDPNKDGHWIAGNDGGCNITYDYGKHWYKVTSIAVGQFYNIATDDAKPYNVYGGLQDNGTWFGPSKLNGFNRGGDDDEDEGGEAEDGPEMYTWKSIGGGDGMQVQVDTRDNKTVYAGSQFGYYGRRSTDGGRGISIHPMHELGEAKLRYNWQTPIWLSKHGQDVFYYGTNKFHRSLNKGEKLEALSGDLTNGKREGKVPYGTLTTIVESPLKFGLIYIGTDDGNIQVTKDDGYTWTKVNVNIKTIPQGLYVSRVMPSMYKESRVYATLNGYRNDHFNAYLFVSEDYGTTWMQLGTDLPAEPLNVVKEDPKKENILYVGSDNGLYASFNRGQSFMTLGNIPRVAVHDIAIQQRDNEMVVGTHGRSIYITKLDAVQSAFDKSLK
ncbi:MAG: glycosyl hydrolase [Bacteroidetes bacterium]|nr:glycosyl hydrolase [Bacteroidota bacterium]